jgi:hypothetical protein
MRRMRGKDGAFAAESEPCPVFTLDKERRRVSHGPNVCLRVNCDTAARRVEKSSD